MIAWEEWETRPARVRMKQFTGFGEGGNGYALLADLEGRGVLVDIYRDNLRIKTRERDEAIAYVGDWVVIGTQNEVYPIEPPVQLAKYKRPGPAVTS